MPQDERGFHLEIHLMGEKQIHYHDMDVGRFHKEAQRHINEFLDRHGIVEDKQGLMANSIKIQWYTV